MSIGYFANLSSVSRNLTGMSASAPREPVVKKKHVRFARMTDEDENDDQEDTLFDKRKDIRRGLKSVLKAAKRRKNQGFDGVEIIDGAGSDSSLGNCSRWMVTLALCASFLGLVNMNLDRTSFIYSSHHVLSY